jgi:hypothetical protein
MTGMWQIEAIDEQGKVMGLAFNIRNHKWMPIDTKSIAFARKDAAISYAEENSLRIGKDVLITYHEWAT